MSQQQSPSCELNASTYALSVITISRLDGDDIRAILEDKQRIAGNFLNNAAVVIDVSKLDEPSVQDVAFVSSLLKQSHFIPVAVQGLDDAFADEMKEINLALLTAGGRNKKTKKLDQGEPVKVAATDQLVNKHIRSGQQIYAAHKNLVVTGMVGNGAEVIADGSIHVYGALRGRAIAGAQGAIDCAIFCTRFEAELVSIAGQYQVLDTVQAQQLNGKSVHVYLEDNSLKFNVLN